MSEGLQYRLMHPPTFGWMEIQLDDTLLAHMWNCINTAGDAINAKGSLIGQIDKSYYISDIDHFLWNNLLVHCVAVYDKTWGNPYNLPIKSSSVPSYENPRVTVNGTDKDYILYLEQMWVNYQNKHDYNPVHNHNGVYSFVIWMNIPTEYKDQAKLANAVDATTSWNSTFAMHYTDSLGRLRTQMYEMGKVYEGRMLFFPSAMHHEVYPYYECDEQRITVSGNIWLKDKRDMTEEEKAGKPLGYKITSDSQDETHTQGSNYS